MLETFTTNVQISPHSCFKYLNSIRKFMRQEKHSVSKLMRCSVYGVELTEKNKMSQKSGYAAPHYPAVSSELVLLTPTVVKVQNRSIQYSLWLYMYTYNHLYMSHILTRKNDHSNNAPISMQFMDDCIAK